MDKRQLGGSLVLGALTFVAAVHTVLAAIFQTGLGLLSAVVGIVAVLLLVVMNL